MGKKIFVKNIEVASKGYADSSFEAARAYTNNQISIATTNINNITDNKLTNYIKKKVCTEAEYESMTPQEKLLYDLFIINENPPVPEEYTLIDYVESNGSHYIITDYLIKQNTIIDINTVPNGTHSDPTVYWSQIAGTRIDYHDSCALQVAYNFPNQEAAIDWGTETVGEHVYSPYNTRLTIHVEDHNHLINDTSLTQTSEFVGNNPYPLWIFACNTGGDLNDWVYSGKIYSFQIHEGENLVRDFKPCRRNADSQEGLYDTVTRHFYEFSTHGDYTELNCIIAHGTERINTNIIPNSSTLGFEVKFQLYNGADYGITNYDWNILNMGGTSVDDNRFGVGGWNLSDDTDGNIQLGPIQGGGSYYDGGAKTNFNQDYIWKYNYNGDQDFYVDNELRYSDLPVGSYQYTHPWNIFTQTFDNNGEAQYDRFFCGKLYYLKIWDGTEMIRDYIPVLDPDGVPCLYDTINGTFNYNEGSGEFEYEEVE